MTQPESKTTMIERLKALRDHIYNLDSGSGEVQLLDWAIERIEPTCITYPLECVQCGGTRFQAREKSNAV